MAQRKIERALISVYDKTGIVDFARALVDEFSIEIISTGGTAKLLKDNGIAVTLVEEITGFPELLDGRVKTLHPKIFAGILADRDNPEHMRQLAEQGIKTIDMVVVDLYPFEKTVADPNCSFEQAIEMIDIGGVSLLRAAAKNQAHVLVVSHIDALDYVLSTLRDDDSITNLGRAYRAFDDVLDYDSDIVKWISAIKGQGLPQDMLRVSDWGPLRYGENPHQVAKLWYLHDGHDIDLTTSDSIGDHEFQEECSVNNYLDLDASVRLCGDIWRGMNSKITTILEAGETQKEIEGVVDDSEQLHCACFFKHTNPCGVAVSQDPIEAYRKAYLGDPNAAMGGFLVCSFPVTSAVVSAVASTFSNWGKQAHAGGFFLDGWAAPSFGDSQEFRADQAVIDLLRASKEWGKRTRLFEVWAMNENKLHANQDYRSIMGGMLVQLSDSIGLNESEWKFVTKRKPTDSELSDLRLAWLIAKHTKSNAISICKDGMLIGNGAGQMSRVMSCRIATWLANENGHAEKLKGSVAASDAFFPFDDGPKLLMDAGVTAIIQPGGSKRDEEVIRACDERDVAMIFTGVRHFKH